MSSDKLSSIREPVAAVDFHIKQGEEEKQVSLELTKEQLKNVVSSLEAANKVGISGSNKQTNKPIIRIAITLMVWE